MKEDIVEKWETAAWTVEEASDTLKVPLHVLLGEAVDVARFFQRNWEPVLDAEGHTLRPGLVSAVGRGRLADSIAADLLELQAVTQQAQTKYRLAVETSDPAPVDRARFVVGELRVTLEWAFDDGHIEDRDAQLEALREAHQSARSQDALAAALFDYAGLANLVRGQIAGLGGFDVALIDEARRLATQLREHSAGPAVLDPGPSEKEALELRNRLVTLLTYYIQRARAAVRFVFRHHPDLVRECSSVYARHRRAAFRRRRLQVQNGATGVHEEAAS